MVKCVCSNVFTSHLTFDKVGSFTVYAAVYWLTMNTQ